MIKQKHKWSCLAACFAFMLGVPEEELYKIVGHDGSEIFWPNREIPQRGFHTQEMLVACLAFGRKVTPIHAATAFEVDGQIKSVFGYEKIVQLMNDYSGVLVGLNSRQKGHAAVWLHSPGSFLDPATATITSDYNFTIETFFIF